MSIALVDYGAGNLTSVVKAFKAVGADVSVISAVEGLDGARAIVVPGVGHFAATTSLGPEWRTGIQSAIGRGVPLFGICLGLQWLFEGSAEAPDAPGLGLMPGRCFRLEGEVKVPHVGWNGLALAARPSRLFDGIPTDSSAYFTHSYAAPVVADTIATTTHAVPFSSAVERGLVFGVQFHPEKSGRTGLRLLTNFLRVVQGAA
ncbi:MAG: imidazole glycerol phosphate synthase, glutamine amidotransferase subunit [Acidobacteria bacterium SCN 69-37]|nr:MAG: imidazole glycerol phosphate synthase, glutamine amidotransferase subunit [Acidobacteria bacterium SCN 69-37]